MMTFLPPISRWQCLKADAQVSETLRPVVVDPVNETMPTSSWAMRARSDLARRP